MMPSSRRAVVSLNRRLIRKQAVPNCSLRLRNNSVSSLSPEKDDVETIVIDHLEPPSEN